MFFPGVTNSSRDAMKSAALIVKRRASIRFISLAFCLWYCAWSFRMAVMVALIAPQERGRHHAGMDPSKRFNPIDADCDCGGVSVSRFGHQRLWNGARARGASRGPAFGRGRTIRRARHVTGVRPRAPDINDTILPGFGLVALGATSVVRRETQAAARGDWTARETQRCFLSCRLPAWWGHLSSADNTRRGFGTLKRDLLSGCILLPSLKRVVRMSARGTKRTFSCL